MGIILFLTWALDGMNGQLHVPAALIKVGPTVIRGKYPPPRESKHDHTDVRVLTWSRHGIQRIICNYLRHISWGIRGYSVYHIFIITIIKRWGLGPLRPVSLDLANAPGLSTFFLISPYHRFRYTHTRKPAVGDDLRPSLPHVARHTIKGSNQANISTPNIFWDAS